MDILISALEGLRASAPDLTRGEIDDARRDASILDAALSVARTRAVDVFHPAPHRDAVDRAMEALSHRRNVLHAKAVILIHRLPGDRAVRSTLRPTDGLANAVARIRHGADEVDTLVRDHSERMEATLDTFVPGVAGVVVPIDAHSIEVDVRAGLVTIGDLEPTPLANVAAVSTEDGLALLLDNGVLIDVRQAA